MRAESASKTEGAREIRDFARKQETYPKRKKYKYAAERRGRFITPFFEELRRGSGTADEKTFAVARPSARKSAEEQKRRVGFFRRQEKEPADQERGTGRKMDMWEQADWIMADAKGEITDRYFEYTADFEVEKGDEVFLSVSAYSQYAAYVNGEFVDCGQYAGYEDLKFYDRLSLSDSVRKGSNRLLLRQYVCGADFSTQRKQIPGVIFLVESFSPGKGGERKVLLASGRDVLSREDNRFQGKEKILTPQLGFCFDYDATAPVPRYRPSVLAGKEKTLFPRPVKKLRITENCGSTLMAQGAFLSWNKNAPKAWQCQHAYFSALRKEEFITSGEKGEYAWKLPGVSFATAAGKGSRECGGEQESLFYVNGDGAYFLFDLGEEKAGLLEFSLDVPWACEVLISFGEHLEDLRVRSAVGNRNFVCCYRAKAGENRFFYPFMRFGLRYLQFLVESPEGTIYRAGVRETIYPVNNLDIPLEDRLHRMIWETAGNTLRLCMHEHYEDCPWREQSLYNMDMRIQMLCGYYAFGEYELPRASLRLAAHTLNEDGFLDLCPPGRTAVNIPSFTAIFPREVLEYVEYSGDVEFAREMLPVIRRVVGQFAGRIRENGLIPQIVGMWNFYEWSPGLSSASLSGQPWMRQGKPGGEEVYDSLLNAFVSDAFACYGNLLKIAAPGKEEEKEEKTYEDLRRRLNGAIHRNFFREAEGGYATFLADERPEHDLTQALSLFAGAVPKEHRGSVEALLKSGTLIPCSLGMSIFEYDALLMDSSGNLPYVIGEIDRIWGRMIRCNTTTFWETALGAKDFDYAGSLCHGWSAVPIYIFGKYGDGTRKDRGGACNPEGVA